VQLISSNSVPGSTDHARITLAGDTLAGFSFVAQGPSDVTPMLAQPEEGGNTVFILIGLSLPAGNGVEVFSTELLREGGRRGIGLVNRGGATLNYSLQVQSAGASAFQDKQFGPFEAPPGAALMLSFPEWPEATSVRAETDLGNNGTIDVTEEVAADYIIFASREGGQVLLRWRSPAKDDVVEQTESLAAPKWSQVNAMIDREGQWNAAKLPATEQERYFRIRR
jgi:hypothetical protein